MTAPLLDNKKAKLRFAVLETFSAGLELLGTEVKALRAGLGSLDGSRVLVRGGEAYLTGMTIPPYQMSNAPKGYDPERTRRLLLTKAEIAQLADAESKKGLTTIPLEVYNNRHLKVRVGIVKNKGKHDRREELKEHEAHKEAARILKRRLY